MQLRAMVIIGVLVGHMVGIAALLPNVATAAGSGVVFSGLQHAGATKSTDEFIELINLSGAAIEVTGWQLQYRSASVTNGTDCAKGWITKTTLGQSTIAAAGHYLFAPTAYLAADASFAAGLAAAGTVRLVDADSITQDALAWGSASCGTGQAAPAPPAGQSLERYAGEAASTGDNATDFFVQVAPAPQSSTTQFAPVRGVPTPTPAATIAPADVPPADADATPPPSASTPELRLNELMIDPVAPSTDADDEFVEIHNAGTEAVDLKGYAIKTGTRTISLPASTIQPDSYFVLTSADSSISLTNSGGVANLLNPDGAVIDTAGTWGSAVPGASWAFIDDAWVWTLSPTPGEANAYTPVPGAGSVEGDANFAALEISELLPDPASPLTDAADEFIEIFNPTDQPVSLTGYTLKVGHDLTSKYVIKDVTVEARDYAVLKSSLTKLALSNNGSSVALYAPGGTQVGATVTYPKASTGDSWALFDSGWSWTSEVTPGTGNVFAAVGTAAAKAAVTKAAAKKASTSKAKAAAKPKATKVPKAAKAKSTAKPLLAGSTSTGGRWLLFVLAGLTIAYIIYEFRYDIRNYYYKLRGYPGGRPATVPVAVEPGSDRAGERLGRG